MAKEKKYQVFISSTYEDLKEERAAVFQALLDLGCIPVGMEQFPASGMSPMEYIRKMLDTCDYYILILAGCYGSIDPSDGVGFTEKEYDYAVDKGMPVMSFIVNDVGKLPNEKCSKTDEQRASLERFRRKVSSGKMIRTYSSIQELIRAVYISVIQCEKDFPAIGWVRADGIDAEPSVESITKEELGAMLDEKLSTFGSPRIRVQPNEAGGDTLYIY